MHPDPKPQNPQASVQGRKVTSALGVRYFAQVGMLSTMLLGCIYLLWNGGLEVLMPNTTTPSATPGHALSEGEAGLGFLEKSKRRAMPDYGQVPAWEYALHRFEDDRPVASSSASSGVTNKNERVWAFAALADPCNGVCQFYAKRLRAFYKALPSSQAARLSLVIIRLEGQDQVHGSAYFQKLGLKPLLSTLDFVSSSTPRYWLDAHAAANEVLLEALFYRDPAQLGKVGGSPQLTIIDRSRRLRGSFDLTKDSDVSVLKSRVKVLVF